MMGTHINLLDKNAFDSIIDGKQTSLYTISSTNGLIVQITNFGLHIVSIWTKDNNGNYADVCLGYKDIDSYTNGKNDRYIGPVVGRYANRIAKGQFTLSGVSYDLPINNNGQSLHGGLSGFDLKVWDVVRSTQNTLEFQYISNDREEGYPSTLTINVIYEVTSSDELKISYRATTDKTTIVNLTSHPLFNLKGEGMGTITDHHLQINADFFTPVTEFQVPTGEISKVDNTVFDLRELTLISKGIDDNCDQIKFGFGYDHNWVLNHNERNEVSYAASLYHEVSGRLLEVYTDQPGVQCYAGNFLDGSCIGKSGKPLRKREGIAIEAQNFADAPNRTFFPSPILSPDNVYKHTCIYKFSVK